MPITGEMLIGATALRSADKPIRATEAATGKPLEPAFGGGTAADVDRACALAWAAFDAYRETGLPRDWGCESEMVLSGPFSR